MPTDSSSLLALSSLVLLAALVVLVLGKRVLRGLAEGRSRRRRIRWVAALGTGPIPDLRMRELRMLANQVARRPAAQEDLLALLDAGRLPRRDARRHVFERAMQRSGLGCALEAACSSRSAVARGRAALIWARLGLEGAEQGVARMVADPDPDVRSAVTHALAWCHTEDAVWMLLHALRDGHMEPERVVERLTGDWATLPLLRAMREPSFEHVQQWLAEALGLNRDPRAERPLADMLARGDEEQRIRACRALGRLGLPTSSAVLATALADPSASVRAQAARALAHLGDVRSIGALTGLLDDESWWVRGRAAAALRALGDPGMAALAHAAAAHPDLFARERAAEVLSLEPDRTAEAAEVAVA